MGEDVGIYHDLGLRSIVNAVGPATRLGGLPLSATVLAAMSEAVAANVRMDELEEAAGAELARLLGVPAVYVTSGASAALTLAVATCVAGSRPGAIEALPFSAAGRRVIVQRAHRDPYDHAITAVGVTLTEIGYPGSTYPDELARELDDSVAAVLWRPGREGELLPLRTVAELAGSAGVPVVVDAAMDAPPVDRLQQLVSDGADLIAISGGKAFRGPHTAGLLCGNADLVATVALHHQDMDIRAQTWQPSEVTGAQPLRGRHGLGRGMKVGREQIAGMLAAVREFVAEPTRWDTRYASELADCSAELSQCPTLAVSHSRNDHLNVPVLEIGLPGGPLEADRIVRLLDTGEPRIHVDEGAAWRGVLTINPMGLHPGEGTIVGQRIAEIIMSADHTEGP
jgi:L-seryl-tRNA(Ser) seleniumtransferase